MNMTKLQKLIQDDEGRLFRTDGSRVIHGDFSLVGKIQALILQNPVDVSKVIEELIAERRSVRVPRGANAYLVSEFDGSTQHIRKNAEIGEEKLFSVYARSIYV